MRFFFIKRKKLKDFKESIDRLSVDTLNKASSPKPTLRLDSIFHSEAHGYPICTIQVIGHNIFTKITAREILTDKELFRHLSYKDYEKIIRLDEQIKIYIDKKIISLNSYQSSFGSKYDHVINVLKYGEEQQRRLFLSEIENNKDLQDCFMGSDAFKLGYLSGQNHSNKINDEFEKARLLKNNLNRQNIFKLVR
ncbi:hypothetical protein L3V86_08375 [Thiotrichales bacterium 19S11-10]|nr:hypothetical protein [Thiotrichales bacterium 19S11-10]